MQRLESAFRQIYRGDNLIRLSEIRYLPRWLVLLIDVVLCFFALVISYRIIHKLNVVPPSGISPEAKYAIILAVTAVFMFVYRTYSGIIRHSSFLDLFKILLACTSAAVTLLVINYATYFFAGFKLFLTPVPLVYLVVSVTLLFLFRIVVKQAFHFVIEFKKTTSRKNVLVVGIGESMVAIATAIQDNPVVPYQLGGFITARSDYKRANLLGKKIYPKEILLKDGISEMFDAILIIKETMQRQELEEWTNLALEAGLQVLKAPSVQKMRSSDLTAGIKQLQIEDLLQRKPISIESEDVKKRHYQKTVLVTGGAGSIGSEIVRQVATFQPSQIIVLDQAETPLYDIELEMKKNFPDINFKFILADISNISRIEPIFEQNEISMVYHAAAYKHVPLIEDNPHEGVFVNILGTRNLADLACKYKINRFVMVSTDKAVNPTNVMGATKRAAELYVQALQTQEGVTTKFITTRFGNVLGSNGSVIPHFKRQIEAGGPVTITHPDIVRYFMTIPEACELVLQAGTMGMGGEIYVFDMGEPVKIVDLATRMIQLSGLEPNVDIPIVYTGLRPGEKLYEELLSDDARTLPTHHEKIMISKDPGRTYSEISELFIHIVNEAKKEDKMAVVKILKDIVPEFLSNNSEFESLDKKFVS
ncbi:polysaccharide biosynthesis protein [Cruoricaptor ignavus]|uniref:polysaccharide biosynthesis protein n=1 Tax=Cruoricaptor ignavus TaxID=1118202 RepID=UPI00370D829A